jgi:hypothetical protein
MYQYRDRMPNQSQPRNHRKSLRNSCSLAVVHPDPMPVIIMHGTGAGLRSMPVVVIEALSRT